MSDKQDLATTYFTQFVQSAAEASMALLSAQLDQCETPQAAAALLGVDPKHFDAADEASQDIMGLTIAFRQIGSMITAGSTLELDSDQVDSLGANAKPAVDIVVRREPERVLTDFYEHGNPAFVSTFFSTPGTAESVEPDAQSIQLRFFDDGSMLGRIQSQSKPNLALRMSLLDKAKTIQEALSPKEAGDLLDALKGASAEMVQDSNLSPKAIALVPQLVNDQALELVRALSLASGSSVCVPLSNHEALLKMIGKHAQEDGLAWKSGVFIEVDGKACANVAEFKSCLSMVAPTPLEDALARLRHARSAAETPKTPACPTRSKPRK
jgi:hypothetical protein